VARIQSGEKKRTRAASSLIDQGEHGEGKLLAKTEGSIEESGLDPSWGWMAGQTPRK